MNYNWTNFFTFIAGLLFLVWFVFLIAKWLKGYFNDISLGKTKKNINPEVAKAMAKKIKEDAEMHRKGRKEGE